MRQNDVKIKIRKTSICGTDVHIYNWNEWAQHTIPIGLTAGHEYVGEIVEVGENVEGFQIATLSAGKRHITLRPLPELSGGAAAFMPQHPGRRRQPQRRIRAVPRDSGEKRVALRSVDPRGIIFML